MKNNCKINRDKKIGYERIVLLIRGEDVSNLPLML